MPVIQIVQVLKKNNNKFYAFEKIIKLCHFKLSGKSLINYYTNIFKIYPYGRNDSFSPESLTNIFQFFSCTWNPGTGPLPKQGGSSFD